MLTVKVKWPSSSSFKAAALLLPSLFLAACFWSARNDVSPASLISAFPSFKSSSATSSSSSAVAAAAALSSRKHVGSIVVVAQAPPPDDAVSLPSSLAPSLPLSLPPSQSSPLSTSSDFSAPPKAEARPPSSDFFASVLPLSDFPPPPAASKNETEASRVPAWRISLEQQLQQAKLEIEASSSSSVETQLTKSLYHNVYKFQKSYELMEKLFRVHVYKEGSKPLVHDGPLTGIYSSEGRFIHEIEQNRARRTFSFVTDDPQEAHMFFLPYTVAHMVRDLYVENSRSMLPLATFIKEYVNQVAAAHPFWNMTRGADHFIVSCHDWGPATARDHQELRENAVKVVCNSDTSEEFVPDKDASLPEIYLHRVELPTRFGGPGAGKRHILAFFAGQMHGRVRPILLRFWKDRDESMKIYEVLPKQVARRMSYEQHMKASRFCICAAGYEVNSPRIVEAIYYGCVPVIVADNFVLPFSDVINWSSFSLTVAEADIPRLKEILMAVPERGYRKMQERLKRVRQHFVWNPVAQRFDMFHMILHSVWTRRLQQLDRIRRLEEQQQQEADG